jgi:cell wall-associated NlpC family hydrolase
MSKDASELAFRMRVDTLVSAVPKTLENTPEAHCVREMYSRRKWMNLSVWGVLGTITGGMQYYRAPEIAPLYFNGYHAFAHFSHPPIIHSIVALANQLVDKPYKWGGGHQVLFDNGFDCSGSISHVLYRARLLDRPLTSSAFASYALPGPGRYVTLYTKPGHHVFMEVCGLRFDTTGSRAGEGPRWRVVSRNRDGFHPRHPAWL